MMNWFFRWWQRGFQRVTMEEQQANIVQNRQAANNNFDGGLNFQLVDAENGKILKVMIPVDPSTQSVGATRRARNYFNPHSGQEEKLYVIPEGEDVMGFITRALVEERIK